MAKNQEKFARLTQSFRKAKIPTDKPGFYDHPSFLAVEAKKSAYLEQYARYVHWRKYDAAYLERARRIIEITAEYLHAALVAENRLGGCIDTSMVLGRILERHGVWNYHVQGALRITFPSGSGFPPFCFAPVDADNGSGRSNGHKWVYAPPFLVIDLTIQLQEYEQPFIHLLPETVLLTDRNSKLAKGHPDDIIAKPLLAQLALAGIRPLEAVALWSPGYLESFSKDFCAYSTEMGQVKLKYVPVGVILPNDPLEKFNNFYVKGKSAFEYYVSEIKPRLDALD